MPGVTDRIQRIAVVGAGYMTFFLPTQVTAITGQKLGFQASLVTAIPWVFALASVAFFPGLADRTRKHRLIGTSLLLLTAFGIVVSGALSSNPVLAIAGLSLAAMGFVAMSKWDTLSVAACSVSPMRSSPPRPAQRCATG